MWRAHGRELVSYIHDEVAPVLTPPVRRSIRTYLIVTEQRSHATSPTGAHDQIPQVEASLPAVWRVPIVPPVTQAI